MNDVRTDYTGTFARGDEVRGLLMCPRIITSPTFRMNGAMLVRAPSHHGWDACIEWGRRHVQGCGADLYGRCGCTAGGDRIQYRTDVSGVQSLLDPAAL